MEPTIFALGLACSQVLMYTFIIAKSIYSNIIEVRMFGEQKYANPYCRILHRQRANSAERIPTTRRRKRRRARLAAGRRPQLR